LIKNQTHFTDFNSEGFFKLQLFNSEEVLALNNIISEYKSHENGISFNGLLYSLFNLNSDLSLELSRKLKKQLDPFLNRLFSNFDSLVYSYIKKETSTTNEFEYHQDWSYTNKKKHFTVTGWLALQDIDEKNGCLFFKKPFIDHKNIVSSTYQTLRFNSSNFKEIETTKVPLKKGEIIFFNPQAFHGSQPNTSGTSRAVITFIIKPKDAPFLYYQKINNFLGKSFEISEQYLMENIAQLSSGKTPSNNLKNHYFFYNYKSNIQKIKNQFNLL